MFHLIKKKVMFLISWIFSFKFHIGKSIFMYTFDSYITTHLKHPLLKTQQLSMLFTI